MGIFDKLLGKKDPREAELIEAIAINPNNIDAHLSLGFLLKDLHRFKEAEKEFRKVIRINPNYENAHLHLGYSLIHLKRYEEAEEEFRESIRINPNNVDAHNSLVNLLQFIHVLRSCYNDEEVMNELLRKASQRDPD